MEVGFAVIPAVGAPPLPLTVTVTWPQSVAPDALVAVKRYVVVAVGETTCDPFTGTGVPFRFPLTAFVDVHVSVELPPDAMEVGFAVIPAVGVSPLPRTVTVTSPQSTQPAAPVAVQTLSH